MCCIFTCCGWMVDLIQRLWTFTMSCCISSAVCCVLIIASMSGIALGYNYSLAEYIDLKETNVSIYLKRGIFDDEIADVEWRRAGHLPVKGQLQEEGLRSGAPGGEETSPIPSGRRLDDSVFETGDQNKYEGSLMKLTAKPPFPSTTPHWITADTDMASVASSYPRDSLDSLKAVQSVIDARKSMASRLGATTYTPVPTYPFHEPEHAYRGVAGGRRMMPNYDYKASMNPARLAVPDHGIGSRMNWVAPKHPELFRSSLKDLGLEFVSITYPSPISLNVGPLRPTPTSSTPGRDVLYLTKNAPITLFSTVAGDIPDIQPMPEKDPAMESIRDKIMLDDIPPRRKQKPKSEEDYDYEIKGLPVRKRRSVEIIKLFNDDNNDKTAKSAQISNTDIPDSNSMTSMTDILNDATTTRGALYADITDKVQNKFENDLPVVDEQNILDVEDNTETPNMQKVNEAHADIETKLHVDVQNIKYHKSYTQFEQYLLISKPIPSKTDVDGRSTEKVTSTGDEVKHFQSTQSLENKIMYNYEKPEMQKVNKVLDQNILFADIETKLHVDVQNIKYNKTYTQLGQYLLISKLIPSKTDVDGRSTEKVTSTGDEVKHFQSTQRISENKILSSKANVNSKTTECISTKRPHSDENDLNVIKNLNSGKKVLKPTSSILMRLLSIIS